MSDRQNYRKCILHRDVHVGSIQVHQAYLPTQFAVIGRNLKLKFENGWSTDWIVKDVGDSISMDKAELKRADEKLWSWKLGK